MPDPVRLAEATVDDLFTQLGLVLLSLLDKFLLLRGPQSVFLSLSGSDLARHNLGVSVVKLGDLLTRLLDNPVILVVVVVTALVHQILEDFAHVVVVRALLEFQIPAVLQVGVELLGKATSQCLDCRLNLLVLDTVVFVVLVLALEALPRQIASKEVYQNEPDTFEVVTPTLLDAQVCVDTGVAGRSSQRLVVLVWDVLASLRVTIPLRKAEVDHMHDVLLLAVSNEEVIRLHVTVDEMVVVQKLKPLDHLISDHQRRFYREFALAEVECVF